MNQVCVYVNVCVVNVPLCCLPARCHGQDSNLLPLYLYCIYYLWIV